MYETRQPTNEPLYFCLRLRSILAKFLVTFLYKSEVFRWFSACFRLYYNKFNAWVILISLAKILQFRKFSYAVLCTLINKFRIIIIKFLLFFLFNILVWDHIMDQTCILAIPLCWIELIIWMPIFIHVRLSI